MAGSPRERVRITKSFVESKNLAPGFYVDEKTDGFRLKVTATGKKIYIVYGKPRGYRTADGKANAITYTIGQHGQPAVITGADGQPIHDGNWTAEKAEREAQRIWGLMRSGINPNEQREQKAQAEQAKRVEKEAQKKVGELTLGKVFNDYIEDKSSRQAIRESTAYVYKCELESTLQDWLDKPLVEINEDHIRTRHQQISKKHPGQANHVMRILRAVFYYAMDEYKTEDSQPIIKNNPVRKFSKERRWNALKKRECIIPDHQLKAFFQACEELNHSIASDYLRFVLLTGLRAEEAASLPWSNVDFKGKTITIAETKNGREHRLPLTEYLYDLLKHRWQTKTTEYVFGTEKGKYMSDYSRQVPKVIERAKQLLEASEDEDIRATAQQFHFMLHDLRRTFGTAAALLEPDYIVKKLMNHVNSNDVTQTHYIHADIEKLRTPMASVGNHILNCAEVTAYGVGQKREAKVVPLSTAQKSKTKSSSKSK